MSHRVVDSRGGITRSSNDLEIGARGAHPSASLRAGFVETATSGAADVAMIYENNR
jgi:hypothetical protein